MRRKLQTIVVGMSVAKDSSWEDSPATGNENTPQERAQALSLHLSEKDYIRGNTIKGNRPERF